MKYDARLSELEYAELDASAKAEACSKARLIARAIHLWHFIRVLHKGNARVILRTPSGEDKEVGFQ